MPWVSILSERGVMTSTWLRPKPAAPQLYSMTIEFALLLRILGEQFLPRCSNSASAATLATHCRSGALAPGAPLISQTPACVCAKADGCAAAASVSTPPAPPSRQSTSLLRFIASAPLPLSGFRQVTESPGKEIQVSSFGSIAKLEEQKAQSTRIMPS